MTPTNKLRETAERVFKLFMKEPYDDGYFNDKPDEQLKTEIESILRETVEIESRKAAVAVAQSCTARSEALEEAAKIADSHCIYRYEWHPAKDACHPCMIASAIRLALKP